MTNSNNYLIRFFRHYSIIYFDQLIRKWDHTVSINRNILCIFYKFSANYYVVKNNGISHFLSTPPLLRTCRNMKGPPWISSSYCTVPWKYWYYLYLSLEFPGILTHDTLESVRYMHTPWNSICN